MSWFAVQGCEPETALSELGWEFEREAQNYFPQRIGVGRLPDGWILIVFNRALDQAFDEDVIALSGHGPAVACSIEEHVMFQEARGYRDGKEIWRITHDPDKAHSLFHLEVSGDPPDSLRAIHEAAVAEQNAEGGEDAGVDLISDVPLLVAKGLCGFKHDDEWPDSLTFTPIRRAKGTGASRDGGFLSRLFGRH